MTIQEHPAWYIIDSTKLQQFMSCPRKYFYQNILGWAFEEPSIHLEFGTAMHIAMERLLQHGYTESAIELAIVEMTLHYRKFFPEIMDDVNFPKTPGFAADMIRKYTKRYANDHLQADVIYTEISGSVPIGKDRVIYFKTDSILKGENGHYQDKYFSREHKTTKSMSRQWTQQWSLKIQVGTYNHVLFCLYGPQNVAGVEINGMIFQKTNPGFVRHMVQKGPTAMNVWLWTVNHYFDMIELELERLLKCREDDLIMRAFPMNTESCTEYFGCIYHDFCTSWHNPLQRIESIPMGMVQKFWNPTEQETTNKMEIKV